MANPISIVVLISGNGSNLQAIIDGIASGQIHGKIRAVISNVADVYGLERAKEARIPTEVIEHKAFDSREAFDSALKSTIDNYAPDLIVMAGFMRRLGDAFVNHYHGRMLNIHPSLLPKYKGLHTHQRALEAGDAEHGSSVHFVTPDLDSGPLVIQAIIAVNEDDTPELLAKRVLREEHVIYPIAISWFADSRLKLEDGKVMLDETWLTTPVLRKQGAIIMPEIGE